MRDLRQIRLPGLEPRGALVADLDLAMGPVRVVAAHLGLLRASRLLQVEALLEHAGETTDRPVVLMGDLNEWRLRRRSALRGFSQGFGPLGLGVPSFPAFFPVLALDRVLTRPHGLIELIAAHELPLSRLASDHLPVRAVVRLDARTEPRPPPRPPPGAAASGRPPMTPPRVRRSALLAARALRPRRTAAGDGPLQPGRREPRRLRYLRGSGVGLAAAHSRCPSARPTRTATAGSSRNEYPLLDNLYWSTYKSGSTEARACRARRKADIRRADPRPRRQPR